MHTELKDLQTQIDITQQHLTELRKAQNEATRQALESTSMRLLAIELGVDKNTIYNRKKRS